MKNLSNTVYSYYFKHLDELTAETRFHLASRLYQWNQDEQAHQQLEALRDWFTNNSNIGGALEALLHEARTAPYRKIGNALEQRLPYFEKYPQLRACNLVLFRLTFLKTLYHIDGRQLFYKHFDDTEVQNMRTELLQDSPAIATLATYATNFLYLYDRFLHEDETNLPIETFLQIGKTAYDFTDKASLQLYIYLYTHCIIGESIFYNRALPPANIATYQTMATDLEQVIAARFEDINLDNKFEFLVAAKLCDYQPNQALLDRIADEAQQSQSPDGNFLVDTVNHFPQTRNISLETSEHRNVLFIMANRLYNPLS